MNDQEIRTLERRAKQTKVDEDIRAWLLALLRADQPLPISDYGWWTFGKIDRYIQRPAPSNPNQFETIDIWRVTPECYPNHRHKSKADARACLKRKCYQTRKELVLKALQFPETLWAKKMAKVLVLD